jgi:hypothetical protein
MRSSLVLSRFTLRSNQKLDNFSRVNLLFLYDSPTELYYIIAQWTLLTCEIVWFTELYYLSGVRTSLIRSMRSQDGGNL